MTHLKHTDETVIILNHDSFIVIENKIQKDEKISTITTCARHNEL